MNRMMIPLMLLLGGAPALAQPISNARSEQREELAQKREQLAEQRLERLTARLGLDADSAAKVRATFEKYRGEFAPLRKSMWTTRSAIKSELASAQPDSSKLAQLTDQLSGVRAQMAALHTQRMAELKSELTPAQYAKLVVSRHEGRGMHRHGRRFERERNRNRE